MLPRSLIARNFKRRLKHWLGFAYWLVILQFVDRIVIYLENSRQARPSKAKILVIRLDGIGDFVLFLDAARKLRGIFPSDRFGITLLGNQLWTSLAKGQSCFDEVWEINPLRFVKSLRYRYQVLKRVRREGFLLLLNPTFSRDLLWADAVAYCCGSEQRIGFLGDLSKITRLARFVSARWYTRLITGIDPATNELQKANIFAEALGPGVFEVEMPRLELVEPVPSDLPDCFYVLCPGAGDSLRRWPPENFAAIAKDIFSETGWSGVVCGSEDDSILAEKLIARTGAPLKNYCGKLSLPVLASTLAASKILVANETGAIHIAAAVKTPSVCIVGGGHLGRFLPYSFGTQKTHCYPIVVSVPIECAGCDWYCKYRIENSEPAVCVSQISVEAVWKRIQSVLTELHQRALS